MKWLLQCFKLYLYTPHLYCSVLNTVLKKITEIQWTIALCKHDKIPYQSWSSNNKKYFWFLTWNSKTRFMMSMHNGTSHTVHNHTFFPLKRKEKKNSPISVKRRYRDVELHLQTCGLHKCLLTALTTTPRLALWASLVQTTFLYISQYWKPIYSKPELGVSPAKPPRTLSQIQKVELLFLLKYSFNFIYISHLTIKHCYKGTFQKIYRM